MVILVVEDNPLLAWMMQSELEEAGHRVAGPVSESGKARSIAASTELDCALVDIDLADGRTGGELAVELSKLYDCSVILASGQSHLADTWRDDVIGLLDKPFDLSVMVNAVDAVREYRTGGEPVWPASMRLYI